MLLHIKLLAFCALTHHIGTRCFDLNLKYWNLATHHHCGATLEQALVEYFAGRTKTLHVRFQAISSTWKYVAMLHLDNTLRTATRLTYRINIDNEELRSNRENNHNLWYVDSYAALNKILPYKKEHFGEGDSFYVIYLAQPMSNKLVAQVLRILRKMFQLNIVNVNLIVRNGSDDYIVYSLEVFQKKKCRKIKAIEANRFKNGRFEKAELFPYKLKNFNNCTLRVMSRNVAPFLEYEYTKTKTGMEVTVRGIEAKLLKLIANTLNFRLKFHINQELQWGDVMENGTLQGPFLLLDNKVVDFLAGYFFDAPHRLPYFEESFSYMRTSIVAVVKRSPPRENLTWMFDPFNLDTWLILAALTIMSVASICLFKLTQSARPAPQRNSNRKRHGGNWLDVIGVLVGTPRPFAPPSDAFRFGFALWCGGLMIITAVYEGKLYDTYHHRSPAKVPTLKDLIAENYTFLQRSTINLQPWFTDFPIPEERIRKFYSLEPNRIYEMLLSFEGKAAIISTAMRTKFYVRSRNLTNKMDIVEEVLLVPEFCMYFPHHSFLIKPFNKVISIVRASGIIKKWVDDVFYDLSPGEQVTPKSKRHEHNHPQAVNVEKLSVVFGIFIGMQMLACFVFVAELWIAAVK